MKVFKILMVATLLLLLFGCAIKRKTKEVERVKVVTENQVKNDSAVSATFKINRNQSDLTINSFESVLKALNVQYDGEQGNDLKVVLNHTENGTELNVSGKGKANYNQASENSYSLNRKDVTMIFDSIIDARVNQMKTERSEQLLDTIKKESEKETTGLQFGAYVGIVLVVCFVLLLGWLGWQFKGVKKLG